MSFEGDLKLFLEENGAFASFVNGQPEMEKGLENFVLISLFTRRDWAGNALLDVPIGSNFEARCSGPITITSLEEARQAALQALDSGVLGDVSVTVGNPTANKRELSIRINPPGQTEQEIRLSQAGENWIFQLKKKPALKPRGTGSSSIYAPPAYAYLDNFVDADSTLITAHLADTGQSYTKIGGDPTPFIQGNKLYCANGRNTPVLINDVFGGAQNGIFEEAYEQAGTTLYPFGFIYIRTPGDQLSYTRIYLLKASWTIFFGRWVGGGNMWGDSAVVPAMANGAHTVKIQFINGEITVILDEGEVSEHSVTRTDPGPTYDGSSIYFTPRQVSYGGIEFTKFTAL